MPINSGIGVGEAQIYDTKSIMNNFYRQYENKKKEDQAFAEKIADNLSKFDTSGLTGKDLEKATKMYDQLRNYNANIPKLNLTERALLDANIRKGMNDIKNFSANAKQFYKDRENFAIDYNKNKYEYLPEVAPIMDKVTTMSYADAIDNGMGDINALRMKRAVDNRLVEDSLADMNKLVKAVAEKTKPMPVTSNGITQIYHVADPNDVNGIVLGILHDDAKKFNWIDNFKRENPNVPNPTDQDLGAFIKKVYEARNGGPNDAYRIKTSEHMAPKPSGPEKLPDNDLFANAANGSFSTNPATRERFINQIKAHGKNRISDIVYNQDGTLTIIPFVKSKLTGRVKPGNPIVLQSPVDLVNQLGGLGVTQAGFGVTTKLNQGRPAQQSGTIRVVMPDGKEGEIPASNWEAFKKKHPNAKRK